MKLEILAEQFYEWLRVQRFTAMTIQDYRYNMRRFFKFLQTESIERLDQLTSKLIYDYQNYLYYAKNKKGGSLSIYTQHGSLSTVQTFCRFLVQTDHLAFDPSSGLTFPKKPLVLPETMTREEVVQILEAVDTSAVLGFRDRAIMEVLYTTGMRSSELRSLTLYDVDLNQTVIAIREGKGGKERLVPLGETAAEYAREYLQAVRPKIVREEQQKIFFLSRNGQKIGQWDLLQIVKKAVRQAGIEKNIHVHTFRHTCATHLLQGGCDLRYIQKLLGHASIISTQFYTQVEVSDLKAVHQKCHPREKLP